MKYEKLLLPICLVIMIALSVSAVSAVDTTSTATATDNIITTDNPVHLTKLSDNDNTDLSDSDKIQSIIDKTEVGGEAIIPEGDYTNINNLKINKTITLRGNGTVNFYGPSLEELPDKSTYVDMLTIESAEGSTANNVLIASINFYSLRSDKTYMDGAMDGVGIKALGICNLTVQNCGFYDLESGIQLENSENILVDKCFFNGESIKVIGVQGFTKGKESGTRGINIKGNNKDMTVSNSVFDGWMLDAISTSAASEDCKVYNNTFKNVAYAFYFGPGISNVEIIGNTFIASNNPDKPTKELVSATKTSKNFNIENNTFVITENVNALYAEAGNTAHEVPTVFGPFSFTKNIITVAEGVDTNKVVPVLLKSNGGVFAPDHVVDLTENTYVNITNAVYFWNADWGDQPTLGGVPINTFLVGDLYADANNNVIYNNMSIKESNIIASSATFSTLTNTYSVTLKDINGNAIINRGIKLTIGGKTFEAITNNKGVATFKVSGIKSGTYTSTISYVGDESYLASNKNVKITVKKVATKLKAPAIKVKVKKSKYLSITLKDANGKILKSKSIKVTFKGKTYTVKTNSKGIAKLKVKLTSKKTYKVTINFKGDSIYAASKITTKVKGY